MKLHLQIERRVLQSLEKVVSKDPVRYVLQGFNIRSLNGFTVITACNGTHLVSIQLATTSEEFDFILPSYIPPTSKLGCLMEVDTDAKTVTYHQSKCDVVYKLIDGKYPEYTKVVPQVVTGTGSIVFNISKIELILSAALVYNTKASVFITPNDKNAAIIALGECPEWFGLLMPIMNVTEIKIPTWIQSKQP
jgi:DNA polymerase III sliding clamp (beta) subunit (PCNA family)